MPRTARIIAPGVAHHVVQRGNNRQDVFFVDDDRRVYLDFLQQHCKAYGVRILGYCLMTNHVHIVAVPRRYDSLAKCIGRTNYLYTLYINRLHKRSGHLWQNRFYSCAMDEAHTYAALAYVERNPVRARMLRVPWRYEWSSAAAHCGGEDKTGLLDLGAWQEMAEGMDWKETLRVVGDKDLDDAMRRYTSTGRPLGSDNFLSKLERRLGRRVRPLPIGRPKQKKGKKQEGNVRKSQKK